MKNDALIDKILSSKSSRHHYIPQFLIEGFTNNEGLVYVYDKQRNVILKKPRSPKSIFFEPNRNTIEILDGTSTSFLEEIYSQIDNKTSRVIKCFQNEDIPKIDITQEQTAFFLYFLITLFWRLPYTDVAAQDVWERSEIISTLIDPEIIRKDTFFQKMERAKLFKHTIDEMNQFGKKGRISVNIHEFSNNLFVLSDNPIVFERTPVQFREFNDIDFLFAVSSRRVYSSTEKKVTNINHLDALHYNMMSIHQSVRYTACSDIKLLIESVKLYKAFESYSYENLIGVWFKRLSC